jgi:hypothetical protein
MNDHVYDLLKWSVLAGGNGGNSGGGGGGESGEVSVLASLIDGSITEVSDSTVTKVKDYAFYMCTKLKTVDLPNATQVGTGAFQNSGIVSIKLPKVKSLSTNALNRCSSLVTVSFPSVETIGSDQFTQCTSLQSADFAKAKTVVSNCFLSCTGLTRVSFPVATQAEQMAFYGCTSLPLVDFPKMTTIGQYVFYGATSFSTLILRSTTMCTLSGTDAFNNTPFASGKAGGKLVVPRALTTEYPNATNWSSIITGNANNRVLALEDYTVDGTITGAIDWDKLNAA